MTTIDVSLIKENADGSAVFSFELSEDMKDALLRFGIMKAIEAGIEASKELHLWLGVAKNTEQRLWVICNGLMKLNLCSRQTTQNGLETSCRSTHHHPSASR
jgi:hypothetical protein